MRELSERLEVRWAVPAGVFVAVVVATGIAAELGLDIEPGSNAATVFLVGALLLYGGTGFAIGQWPAMALTLVPVLVAMLVGGTEDDSDGVAAWVYTAIDTVVLFGPVMLAGITSRKALSFVIRRRGKDDSSGDRRESGGGRPGLRVLSARHSARQAKAGAAEPDYLPRPAWLR